MTTRSAFWACAVSLFVWSSGVSAAPLPRYAYLVSCGAVVEKIDSVTNQVSKPIDLSAQMKLELLPGVNEAIDDCLAQGALYDPAQSVFYTISPKQARVKPDGTKDYVLLTVSVPAIKIVATKPIGTYRLGEEPVRLAMKDGLVAVVDRSAPLPSDSVDEAEIKKLGTILEVSGDSALVDQRYGAAAGLRVVNRTTKSSIVMKLGFSYNSQFVHLAPGGKYVFVEEVLSDGKQTRTGKSALYSASTGDLVHEYVNPQVKSMHFVLITPNGRAVYNRGEENRLVTLKQIFENVPVTRVEPEANASHLAFFFAAK